MSFSIFFELNLFFLGFITHQDSYVLKCNQITIVREIKDTERHIHRKEEDEKYSTILVNRRHENESVKINVKLRTIYWETLKKWLKIKNL